MNLCLPPFPLGEKPTNRYYPLPKRKGDPAARYFRDESTTADSALVTKFLDADDDPPTEPVLRPLGSVIYFYHIESDPNPATQRRTYSSQLWCKNQPWSLYDERQLPYPWVIVQKSWLIASGHAGK
jgi:hypothetical protein